MLTFHQYIQELLADTQNDELTLDYIYQMDGEDLLSVIDGYGKYCSNPNNKLK